MVGLYLRVKDVTEDTNQVLCSDFGDTQEECTFSGSITLCNVSTGIPGVVSDNLYQIRAGNQQRLFDIDRSTGEIYLRRPVFAGVTIHLFVVAEVDQNRQDCVREVIIDLVDLAGDIPRFVLPVFQFAASEDLGNGQSVGFVTAKPDNTGISLVGRNKPVPGYSITTPDVPFDINGESGEITLAGKLDYEEARTHLFQVQVLGYASTVNVRIDVLDTDDEAPRFKSQVFDFEIDEDLLGLAGVTPVTDRDTPAHKLSYSTFLNTPMLKYISFSDGVVRVISPLNISDLETMSPSYFSDIRTITFGVVVSDSRQVHVASFNLHLRTPIVKQANTQQLNGTILEGKPRGEEVNMSIKDYIDAPLSVVLFQIQPISRDFSIDNNTGALTSKRMFDRESSAVRQVAVVVVDRADQCKQLAVFLISVSILDVNDETPTFNEKSYQINIPEGFEGISSLILIGRDNDAGQNSDTSASLTGTYSGQFALLKLPDNSFGTFKYQLNVTVGFDYETLSQTTFNLTVNVSDRGFPSLSSDTFIIIRITDINDNAPVFDRTRSPYSIVESSSPRQLEQLHATDRDTGFNGLVTYFILPGSAGRFTIDRDGVLTALSLDYEKGPKRFVVVVWAVDQGSPALSSSTTIDVQVTDSNDNPPVFSQNFYQADVEENTGVNFIVIAVNASDADSGPNSEIEYSLDYSRYLTIDSNGIVRTNQSFDYENPAMREIVVNVQASDKVFTRTAKLLVRCIDVNDVAPTFSSASYTAKITNGSVSDTIVAVVSASDVDTPAADLIYSISPGTLFKIGNDGIVRVKDIRLVSTDMNLTLEVKVNDSKSTNTTVLEVTIVDQLKGIPLSTKFYTSNVLENVTDNSEVLSATVNTTFNVTFEYHGPVEFKNISTGKHFTIINRVQLDREGTPAYTGLMIVTKDGDPNQFAIIDFSINLVDVNDNPPTCSQSVYQFTIKENNIPNAFIGTVNASDPDVGVNAMFSYSVTGIGGGLFSVDGNGALRAKVPLDRETRNDYSLIIEMVDKGSPSQTGECVVLVEVGDVDDTAPTVTPSQVSVRVRENTQNNTMVVVLTAVDPDTNTAIRYSLKGGRPEFHISETSGIITTTAIELDREEDIPIVLYVLADDRNGQTGTATLSIEVEDVNDNPPVFTSQTYQVKIPSNTSVGELVITMNATDKDPDYGVIVYSLQNSISNFYINFTSGEITLAQSLREISRSTEKLYVLASDNGGVVSMTATATVLVEIRGNIYDPYFEQTYYKAYVDEETNASVIALKAIDNDNGTIFTYNVVSAKPSEYKDNFEMVSLPYQDRPGTLRVIRKLDRETMASKDIILTIRVSDDGIPVRENVTVVNVTIKDVNDNAPVWRHATHQVNLSQTFTAKTSFQIPAAVDVDEGEHARIVYEFVAAYADFAIDRDTGNITATKNCTDCVRPEDYTYKDRLIGVKASDPDYSSTLWVDITLLYDDPNKHYPRFINAPTTLSVDITDGKVDKEIVQMYATDDDEASRVTFSLHATDERTLTIFSINETTGKMYIHHHPDANRNRLYVTVVANDNEPRPKYSNVTIEITVKSNQCDSGPILTALIVVAVVLCIIILILAILLAWQWKKKLKAQEDLKKVRIGAYMKPNKRERGKNTSDSAGSKFHEYNPLQTAYLTPAPSGGGYQDLDMTERDSTSASSRH